MSKTKKSGKKQKSFFESWKQVAELSRRETKAALGIILQINVFTAEDVVVAEGRAARAVAAGAMTGAGATVEHAVVVVEKAELAADRAVGAEVELKVARGLKVAQGVVVVVVVVGRV